MNAIWELAKFRRTHEVNLSGQTRDDDVIVPTLNGDRRFRVDRVTVDIRWTAGQEEHKKVRTILAARRRQPGGTVGESGTLLIGQLAEVPPWLAEIIAAARRPPTTPEADELDA